MFRFKALAFVVVALLASSCGQDQPEPAVSVTDAPTTTVAPEPADTTSTAPAVKTDDTDDAATSETDHGESTTGDGTAPSDNEPGSGEQEGTTTTDQVECPEGTHPVDGECWPVETPEVEAPTTDAESTVPEGTDEEACLESGGTWDASALTCEHPGPGKTTPTTETAETTTTTTLAEVETPDETASDDEEPGVETDEQAPAETLPAEPGDGTVEEPATEAPDQETPAEETAEVVYWHPNLHDNAFESVNPGNEPADYWETRTQSAAYAPLSFEHYVFHHYQPGGDIVEQQALFDDIYQDAVSAFAGLYIWHPYRYDIAWAEYPNVVVMVGTYPLGERRDVVLAADVPARQKAVVEDIPFPPPIRPTTPFAEPRWPEIAAGLGRDCPPVEEVWRGYGAEVTDICTMGAVYQAVGWMWRGDAPFRQWAIRDGDSMIDYLEDIDNIEDPYMRARLGFDSRVNGSTRIRDVKWAGHWPGASMIYLEWNVVYQDREFTPEEIEAKDRLLRDYQGRGIEIGDERWGDGISLDDIGWSWKPALIVRTADGTWRMSYRSVCYWYESVRDFPLCPDDPNPHFPDSAFFDEDIFPPYHPQYYHDRRLITPAERLPHQDGGNPRLNDEYVGVPPS